MSALFLSTRFFTALFVLVVGFTVAFFIPVLLPLCKAATGALAGLSLLDAVLLLGPGRALTARRTVADKLSNGSDNPIRLYLENRYRFTVRIEALDEMPEQLQLRDIA